MSSDESVIKVKPSYETGASAKIYGDVKLVPSGTKGGTNARVARSDGSNVEQMLAETIIPAIRAADDNPPTAEKDKFKFMNSLLETPIYQIFKQVYTDLGVNPASPSDGDFIKVVKRFLTEVTTYSTMRDSILRYLETGIRKPRDMTPQNFYLRFMEILRECMFFEGIKPDPTEEETKDWYFRAFPTLYRLDYEKTNGKSLPSMTAITSHMTLLHKQDLVTGLSKKDKPSTKEKPVTRNERGTDRRRRGREGAKNRGRSNHSKKTEQLSDDAHCVVHPQGNHTWGECSMNPENKDKKESKDKKDSEDRKRDRRPKSDEKKRNGKHHSHHVDQHSEDPYSSADSEEEGGEVSGSESEGSSSNKRMKHSSHHADGDELSEDVENMGIEVHDAYPEE